MIVVCNATPLIHLSASAQMSVLRLLFGRIYIPKAVYGEVAERGLDRAGATDLREADWVTVHEVANRNAVSAWLSVLDLGEAECIELARACGLTWSC